MEKTRNPPLQLKKQWQLRSFQKVYVKKFEAGPRGLLAPCQTLQLNSSNNLLLPSLSTQPLLLHQRTYCFLPVRPPELNVGKQSNQNLYTYTDEAWLPPIPAAHHYLLH